MGDDKTVQGAPCSWCRPGYAPDTCIGYWRNFEKNFAEDIPVCGGCAGIGVQYDDAAFRGEVRGLMHLRLTYCPSPTLGCLPHPAIRLKALEALVERVSRLYLEYGDPSLDCCAKRIVEGAFAGQIKRLQQERKEALDQLRVARLELEEEREPLLAFAEGDVDRADALFQQLIRRYPESSILAFDYGLFIIQSSCHFLSALPWLELAASLSPQKARHYLETARCLASLNRHMEAFEYARAATDCADASTIPHLRRLFVDDVRSPCTAV